MWKLWQLCYILLHLYTSSSSQETTFNKTGMREMYLQMARNANITQDIVPDYVLFPCNVTGGRSPIVPNSVHKLKPGDIDVIAAMGDSLTAGAGALAISLPYVLVENRGVSTLGGGESTWREYLTLPNIIKEFNPNLIGYALGDSLTPVEVSQWNIAKDGATSKDVPHMTKIKKDPRIFPTNLPKHCKEFTPNLTRYALGDSLTSPETSQLNVAKGGATSKDMPYMAEILIEKIKKDSRIDLHKHWKLISLMIGDNDICVDICCTPSPWSIIEKYKANMLQVLRILRDNLPRTFVTLVSPPHLRIVYEKKRPSFQCLVTTDFECPCIFDFAFQRFLSIYFHIMRRLQELNLEIATYPEFQRDDFAVVTQPIMLDSFLPLASDGYTDMTYLSADCLHFSQKTDARMANGVWNNLLEPVGSKRTKWDSLFETFHCPTPDRPYLATMLNSIKKK